MPNDMAENNYADYAIIPLEGSYWIAVFARDGTRRFVERFDSQEMAVKRLQSLRQKEEGHCPSAKGASLNAQIRPTRAASRDRYAVAQPCITQSDRGELYNMDLEAARVAAMKTAARIDINVKAKLLKRARKHGVTNQDETVALAEAWKRAARKTDQG